MTCEARSIIFHIRVAAVVVIFVFLAFFSIFVIQHNESYKKALETKTLSENNSKQLQNMNKKIDILLEEVLK